jgi:hypothetical protein
VRCSSGASRKRRVFPQGSLDPRAPVLLDRRFRCRSIGESGLNSSMSVGREMPCFRCWSCRVCDSSKTERGYCARYSQSPCYGQIRDWNEAGRDPVLPWTCISRCISVSAPRAVLCRRGWASKWYFAGLLSAPAARRDHSAT